MKPQESGFTQAVQLRRNGLKAALKEALWYPVPRNKELGVGIGVDFGYTKMPSGHGHRFHKGVDMHAEVGSSIFAVAHGMVVFADRLSDAYGNCVIIAHKTVEMAWFSVYAHCDEIYVAAGDVVWADPAEREEIASIGHTGNASGPHLHFEVRLLGNATDAVVDSVPLFRDPMEGEHGAFWEDEAVILRERSADF